MGRLKKLPRGISSQPWPGWLGSWSYRGGGSGSRKWVRGVGRGDGGEGGREGGAEPGKTGGGALFACLRQASKQAKHRPVRRGAERGKTNFWGSGGVPGVTPVRGFFLRPSPCLLVPFWKRFFGVCALSGPARSSPRATTERHNPSNYLAGSKRGGPRPTYSPEAHLGGFAPQTKDRGERREEASPWASLWCCDLFLAGGLSLAHVTLARLWRRQAVAGRRGIEDYSVLCCFGRKRKQTHGRVE